VSLCKCFSAEYADLPFSPPVYFNGNLRQYSYGVNFASSGAGALPETNQGLVHFLFAIFDRIKSVFGP